jgi:hypothetical protein
MLADNYGRFLLQLTGVPYCDTLLGNGSINTFPLRQILGKQPVDR